TALAALATLRVAGRAPKTGYERARFGQAWADVDRNGCDTRNDVLRRDLTHYALKAGTYGCLVLKGTLHDPYTGRTIAFVRGQSTSIAVQVDHVVALSDAWQKGAQGWSTAQRIAFANDSLNLLAVDGPTNASKGDGDAATWLPPVKSYRCAYVARQVAVKRTYGLWVTRAEKDAIARVLARCPDQKLPSRRAFRLGGGTVVAAPAPSTTTSAPARPSSTSGTDPRFGTCKEAKSHGYGPYERGVDPEYDWYRDNDHDGMVCE
ncbi:MAG: GmrSD restriction endonuclease domain-containing protein, partial [Angustibacter sp.]